METNINVVEGYIHKKRRSMWLIGYVVLIYSIYVPFMCRISRIVGSILLGNAATFYLYVIYIIVIGFGLMMGAYFSYSTFKHNSAVAGALISLIW